MRGDKSKKVRGKYREEFFTILSSLQNTKEGTLFLQDLFTPQEIDTFAERIQLVKQLLRKKPQREVAQHLHTSISKVERGMRMIKYGTGGFKKVLMKFVTLFILIGWWGLPALFQSRYLW
jgi:Trp operon repressor